MKHFRLLIVPFLLAPLVQTAAPAWAQRGVRPRNLVVRADGTVLVTSMGSNEVTQLKWNGSSLDAPTYIAVGGRSWGVCLESNDRAVITLPFEGRLVTLAWDAVAGSWKVAGAVDVPYYCTELVDNPLSPSRVYVANRGAAPAVPNAEEWQHAVYEVDIDAAVVTRTFVTDREPRALALSPSGRRLFVGHIQGALGGSAIDATTGRPLPDHPLSNPIYDGGSVIVFDAEAGRTRPLHRFGVGSPVRGLAVMPTGAGPYRIYFTHVGYGASAEAPKFGGRDVANLVTSIAFDAATDEPLGTDRTNPAFRQDFALGHAPDSEVRGAILHENLAVRRRNGRRELWITNSGSGSVSRVRLTAAGLADSDGRISITFPRILPGVPRAAGGWLLDANMTAAPAEFETVSIDTVRRDSVAQFDAGDVGSNPRGIIYDGMGGRDRVLAVTQLSHTLVRIGAGPQRGRGETALQPAGEANPVIQDEKNFFTFGKGFDFREAGLLPGGVRRVNNMTCATCHVEGHIDGKIRFTVRSLENLPLVLPEGSMEVMGEFGKPVHVASVFDMGSTEWMFFEGLKTIRDGIDPRNPHTTAPPDTRCGYCLLIVAGFFFDTERFTRNLESPMSPHAPDGFLSPRQNEGRLLFEAMNCSRCHAGATRRTFPRTQEAADNLPPGDPEFTGNGQFGPTPVGLEQENRILHDPTQVVFKNDLRVCPPGFVSSELMNMTDVGTRNARDGDVIGINSPGLAGAWDNRPYMHDGRYRTLLQVLDNTYLNTRDANRAAPLVFAGVPDNANGGVFPGNPCEMSIDPALFEFNTHKQYTAASPPPDSLRSAREYLTSIGKLDEFIEFLSAVSSRTDLCAGESNIPDALGKPVVIDSISRLTWTTRVPAECRVLWGPSATSPPPNEIITPLGTRHAVDIPVPDGVEYRVVVSAYTRGLCVEQPTIERVWTVDRTSALRNDLKQNYPNPFNPVTSIGYSIKTDSHVRLTIFDVRGARVRTLVDARRQPDNYVVDWDGRDDNGTAAATGVYFYRLKTTAFVKTRKMVLLK